MWRKFGSLAPGLLLVLIAFVLLFGLLPLSRDASRGIVTVYSINPTNGTSYPPAKYKAIIDAQEVVELIAGSATKGLSRTIRGFDTCAVFDRKNWQCRRAESIFVMDRGQLAVGRLSRAQSQIGLGPDRAADVVGASTVARACGTG